MLLPTYKFKVFTHYNDNKMKFTIRFSCIKTAFLFIYFISVTVIYGQNSDFHHKKDSLLKIIESTQGEEKLKAYEALAWLQFPSKEVDLMLRYANEFINEARKQRNKDVESRACRAELVYLYNSLKFDEFNRKANEYLPFFKKNGFSEDYYDFYLAQIQLLETNGNYKPVIEGIEQMYAEAKQEDCLYGITQATALIAQIYNIEKRYEDAEKYIRESIKTALKLLKPEETGQSANYHLVSNRYNILMLTLLAQNKINECLPLMSDWKKHIISFEKRYDCPAPYLATYYKSCADIYIAKKDYNKVELYCDSLELINLAPIELYWLWGIKANICENREDYNSAIDWINKSINYVSNSNSGQPVEEISLLKDKARILSKMGQAEETYSVLDRAFILNDSIHLLENNAQLDEIRTQYEIDKHIAEKERQRIIIFSLIGGLILSLIALGIWISYSRAVVKKNHGLYRQIKEQDRLKDQLDALSKQETIKLQGNNQQRQLVSHLHEYLLRDKTFVNFDIDINKIALELASNRTYLFDAIKTVTGKTLMEYINYLRLEEAKRLLEYSDLTIENITAECGFNTQQTFYRLFRDYYQITPSNYRKIAKTSQIHKILTHSL